MKYTTQFECIDQACNTVVLGTHRQEGINCPRCDGPVIPKPFQPIKKVSEDAMSK
jgi:DNA-directed RNA polymerase subunit RPC12/RpoP